MVNKLKSFAQNLVPRTQTAILQVPTTRTVLHFCSCKWWTKRASGWFRQWSHLKTIQKLFQVLEVIEARGMKHPVLIKQLVHDEVHKSNLLGTTIKTCWQQLWKQHQAQNRLPDINRQKSEITHCFCQILLFLSQPNVRLVNKNEFTQKVSKVEQILIRRSFF